MRVTMHQPEHMPWTGFFHKMALADQYVVMDMFQYRHQYFQNRNRIQGVQGPIWLNVPVLRGCHRYGLIRDVRIDNSRNWRKRYWGSIEYHYHRHPHYARYAEALHALVHAPWEYLADFNLTLIGFFRSVLAIETPMVLASNLDTRGQRDAMILHLARQLGARTYLSGPSGRDYLDEAPFAEADIAVDYHAYTHPTYAQHRRTSFTPGLSTLDLIMNCGPESRQVLFGIKPETILPSPPEGGTGRPSGRREPGGAGMLATRSGEPTG
ncbi:MAG TPA: WbqC family protein [Oscillatoriaceae cyanobacterium]